MLLFDSVDGEDDPFADEVMDNIGRGGTRADESSDEESEAPFIHRVQFGEEFEEGAGPDIRTFVEKVFPQQKLPSTV